MDDENGTTSDNENIPQPPPPPVAGPVPPPPSTPPQGQGGPTPPPPPPPMGAPQPGYAPGTGPGEKSKVVAGVLGILLGSLGIHKFYLGYTTEGIILLAVTVVSFGTLSWVSGAIGLVEGIIYLTKSDEEFYQTYVVGKKKWF